MAKEAKKEFVHRKLLCFAMGCERSVNVRVRKEEKERVSYEGVYCQKCHRSMFNEGTFR